MTRRRPRLPLRRASILAALLCVLLAACEGDPAPDPRLVASGPGSKPLAAWADDLDDDDAQTRLLGAEALRRAGDAGRPHLPALIALLEGDPDAGVRRTAAGALGELGRGSPRAAAALDAALGDEASGVRAWAARGLQRLGPEAVGSLPRLRALAEDPSWDVRRAVARAIEALEAVAPAPGGDADAEAGGPDPPPERVRRLEELGYAPGSPTSVD